VAVTSAEPYADHLYLASDRNHASTTSCTFFYGPDALPDAQTTVSKHCRVVKQLWKNWLLHYSAFSFSFLLLDS